jgi:hypothetical protein
MDRLVISIVLVFMVCSAHAELTAPARTLAPITDPAMIVMDRGAKLEVFPTKRAVPATDRAGRQIAHQIVAAGAARPFGPKQLGVVFNHAMQQRGTISGEITFKMKPGKPVKALDRASYPGLQKITDPEVYVVNARTPAEFILLLERLQARPDLEWVEPTVMYGPTIDAPAQR